MKHVATLVLAALAAAAPAQEEVSYGEMYAFDEREPRTRVEQVIDARMRSLVKVHGASGLSTIEAYATGVLVSEEGHVLTLDLVMIQPQRTRVVLYDGSVHRAKLLPTEDRMGLRLLKIDPADVEVPLEPLWPADEEVPNGTFVVSLGNCYRLAEFSEKLSALFGVLVGRARTGLRYRLADVDDYQGELLITDAANNPGHYGGALFTLEGDWIGLNARMVESKETNTDISAAIPSRDLIPFLERFVRGIEAEEAAEGSSKPVAHGIRLFDHGGRRSPPAYVARVRRGSPADALGLRPDDLIVRIDDWPVRSCVKFREVMAKYSPGDRVRVTYKRGTDVLSGEMTLEARK